MNRLRTTRKPSTRFKSDIEGEVICFTGKSIYTRVKMQQLAKQHGAEISGDITSRTTMLVVGLRSGSKLERALFRGIRIIADEEYLNKIDCK